jgi:transposase
MCDLSPIELAWAKVKRLIREKSVAGEMSLSVLKDVTMDAFSSVTRVIGKDIVAMCESWKQNTGKRMGYWRTP